MRTLILYISLLRIASQPQQSSKQQQQQQQQQQDIIQKSVEKSE